MYRTLVSDRVVSNSFSTVVGCCPFSGDRKSIALCRTLNHSEFCEFISLLLLLLYFCSNGATIAVIVLSIVYLLYWYTSLSTRVYFPPNNKKNSLVAKKDS